MLLQFAFNNQYFLHHKFSIFLNIQNIKIEKNLSPWFPVFMETPSELQGGNIKGLSLVYQRSEDAPQNPAFHSASTHSPTWPE